MVVYLRVDFSRGSGRWTENLSLKGRYTGEVELFLSYEGTLNDLDTAIDTDQVVVEVPGGGEQLVTRDMVCEVLALKSVAA